MMMIYSAVNECVMCAHAHTSASASVYKIKDLGESQNWRIENVIEFSCMCLHHRIVRSYLKQLDVFTSALRIALGRKQAYCQ
jgi:hypothetical protein